MCFCLQRWWPRWLCHINDLPVGSSPETHSCALCEQQTRVSTGGSSPQCSSEVIRVTSLAVVARFMLERPDHGCIPQPGVSPGQRPYPSNCLVIGLVCMAEVEQISCRATEMW